MANYTITEINTRQNVSTNLSSELDSFSERTLVISPNPGYVVSSNSFSQPQTLPNGIESIDFSDTGEAKEPSNKVEVLVTFDANYIVTQNTNISLGIIGDAVPYVKPPIGSEFSSAEFYLATSEELTGCTASKTVENNFTFDSVSITGFVESGINTHVATYTFLADSGTKFSEAPLIESDIRIDGENGIVTSKIVNIEKDSDGNIISYEIKVFYYSKVPSNVSDSLVIDFLGSTSEIVVKTRKVRQVEFFGDTIGVDETSKFFRIKADVGAKWNFTIEKVGSPNVVLANLVGAETIKDPDNTSSVSKYFTVNDEVYSNWTQIFPSTTNVSETYNITITAGDGTTIDNNFIPSTTPTYTITQSANPTISFDFATQAGVHYSAPSSISVTGRPNTFVSDLPQSKQEECRFSIDITVQTDVGYSLAFSTLRLALFPHTTTLPIHEVRTFTVNTKDNTKPLYNKRMMLDGSGNSLFPGMTIFQEDYNAASPVRIWEVDNNDGTDPDDLDSDNVEFIDGFVFDNYGDNLDVTFIGTSWNYNDRFLEAYNGGSIFSMTNVQGTLVDSRTFNLKADVNITKFGQTSTQVPLDLSNILEES